MGFITDSITQAAQGLSKTGNECNGCNNSSKAVAGMENNPESAKSNNQTGNTDTAVVKQVDDKQYTLMGAPISALFTKALDVKYDNNRPNAELAAERPVIGNESAAQDTVIQRQAMINNGAGNSEVEHVVTRLCVGKSQRFKGDPVILNLGQALKQIQDNVQDVEFVFVEESDGNGRANNYITYPRLDVALDDKKQAVGVAGVEANDPNPTWNLSMHGSRAALEALAEQVRDKGLKVSKVQIIVHHG